jgi:hypothetical protein
LAVEGLFSASVSTGVMTVETMRRRIAGGRELWFEKRRFARLLHELR